MRVRPRHLPSLGLVLLACLGAAGGDDAPPALAPGVPTLVAVPRAPARAGAAAEPVWTLAPALALPLRAEGASSGADGAATLAALLDGEQLLLRLAWPDATYDVTARHADACQVAPERGAPGREGARDGADDLGGRWSACPDEPPVGGGARARLAWERGRWSGHVALRPGPCLFELDVRDADRGTRRTPRFQVVVGGAPVHAGFDDDAPGGPPQALAPGLAGAGAPPAWEVRAEPGAGGAPGRVLLQTSQDMTNDRFPVALLRGFAARDVDVSVRFQARDGFKDRGAGLVWRVQDLRNHYILRANALEQNVVLYKMEDGLRVDLPPVGHAADYGAAVAFAPEAWHTLRVTARGDRFQAYLDGALLFEVVDSTFSGAGGVGLWTKSDSVMAFDDLVAVPLR